MIKKFLTVGLQYMCYNWIFNYFRGFEKLELLDIKPITLISGKNNAGVYEDAAEDIICPMISFDIFISTGGTKLSSLSYFNEAGMPENVTEICRGFLTSIW